MRLVRLGLAASLSLSTLLALVWSWHWPLVGDASLIHYISFLIERGWAPYRNLGDMNMPGSFLIELAAMHLFGMGARAWRLFDFSLLALASAAFFAILNRPSGRQNDRTMGRGNWFAALFASALFALIHLRDGLAQGGQRDLTMAVCLLGATAFLLTALRGRSRWAGAAFGLLSGVGFTIKPTTALFTVAQMLLAAYWLRRSNRGPAHEKAQSDSGHRAIIGVFPAAAAGYLIAPGVVLLFLLRENALAAFFAGFHGIVPYYASLGHRPLTYILVHSVSPVISLVILWIVALALYRTPLLQPRSAPQWLDPDLVKVRAMLAMGVLFGLINCIVQARALPYYRYPLLAFLLPLMALDLTTICVRSGARTMREQTGRVLAAAAILVGSLFLAPQSAVLVHRYRWGQTDFITSLEQDLDRLGGPHLSGHIQCIDSVSGCGTVLYRMRLEPSTGVLSDFLLFGAVTDPPTTPAIVRDTRSQFAAALLANPPQVIVVTSHLHIDGPDGYRKLDRWPAFEILLADDYTLSTEWTPTRTNRWWSREELPAGYRIYVLRRPR
jgi:hypothetical protein